MSSPEIFTLRWGIIGAGSISSSFVKDALLDPKTRNVTDVQHTIAAVASRDVKRAQEFIDKYCKPSTVAYGSYEEIVADKNIDAVYIGTPHTHHYANARLALEAGKNVLCEKPFTSNAAELRSLIEIAKKHNVFLMEALWTRFLPISQEIKKITDSGELGDIRVVHADLSGDFDVDHIPKTHRILDPQLGGGALLDLGPYPIIWAMMCLYEHPKNALVAPDHIAGTMLKTPLTGVDASTSFSLTFSKLEAQAILSCSITLPSPNPAVTIRYRNGNVLIHPPPYAPRSYTVQWFDKPGSGKIVKEEKREVTWVGGGWHFQADEVARCVRDGKKESDAWSLDKSLVVMNVFDKVREQGGYKFPEGVEQVV
ncbi:NAD(P)-binding protein [Sistotremastrum niveocremeum HHB9708]|uniref:D-xylose 1-dehydrogenase (NADP(+), D-xylono-1,5-lactone-forming) n=2 Tax=Sistotremastraceae TaxID=3402574 RepID=A0A164VUQ1_9AGAM|nr:NAD(P)-binding protein [Sistotremastrum niveocremeum HHB9708]KZT43152.1 NAD(P)-binding protein [Sistotremastrum suecicum HHB10207 ss-3]